jgi:hypothetical protein
MRAAALLILLPLVSASPIGQHTRPARDDTSLKPRQHETWDQFNNGADFGLDNGELTDGSNSLSRENFQHPSSEQAPSAGSSFSSASSLSGSEPTKLGGLKPDAFTKFNNLYPIGDGESNSLLGPSSSGFNPSAEFDPSLD